MEIKICPESPKFHENLLDVFGRNFMDNIRGIGEWLKNSIDAYIREGISGEQQHIIINFNRDIKGRAIKSIECVDFVGATFKEIDESLKVWGDPEAASRGRWTVYGGHGNGGKFYMRQMFDESYFISYKDGFLTVFGFDKNKKYGFDNNYKGFKTSFNKAIEISGLTRNFFDIVSANQIQKCNFTVVKGIGPKKIGKKYLFIDSVVTSLIRSPQSRQILNRAAVSLFIDGKLKTKRIRPEIIKPRKNYEEPFTFEIPNIIKSDDSEVEFPTNATNIGELIIRTSEIPFSKNREDNILNCIDIIGNIGIIASYQMNELDVKNRVGAEFIYGECTCPILENPLVSCVQNDRSKLVENDYSLVLIKWISDKIDEIALRIQNEEKDINSDVEKNIISYFNKLLNSWSKNFFKKFMVDIYGGAGEGKGFGGTGSNGFGHNNKGEKIIEKEPKADEEKGGFGDKKIKRPQFPQVLVSGIDSDPLSREIFFLNPRQDIIYQRPEDVENHIWWINAQKPFAKKILNEEGPESSKWKAYLFQRYIDIIINYMIEERWKIEPSPDPTTIQQWIFETLNEVYNSAYVELEEYLFE